MYKIAKENLSALFQSIAENQELYLPVEVSGQVNFKAWTQDANVSLETLKTVKSPNRSSFHLRHLHHQKDSLVVLEEI